MAKGEVVLDRIGRIESPKHRRDLFGGGPRGRPTIGEAQVSADAVNVSVYGYDQRGRGDWPETEVDPVGRADHPSRIQDQALAGAASPRIAHQMARVSTRGVTPKGIGEPRQRLAKARVARSIKARERAAERFVLAEKPAGAKEHRCEVLAPVDAVDESPETLVQSRGIVADHGVRGRISERAKHALDALFRSHGVAEREARSHQPGNLLIAGLAISVNEIDRISSAARLGIRACQQGIETFARGVHFRGLLAILPSQPQ